MSVRLLRIGDCTLDRGKQCIVRDGVSIKLQPRDFGVLLLLSGKAPDLVTNQEIMAQVWQGKVVGDNVLYQSIARLRKALGDIARQPTYIETIAKRGYRLIAPVAVQNTTPRRELELSPVAVFAFRNYSVELVANSAVEGLGFELAHNLIAAGFDVMSFEQPGLGNDPGRNLEIAADAGANSVLTGSIIINRQTLRVMVSLGEVASQRKLWTARYDLKADRVFEMQSLLGETIVEDIRHKFKKRLGPRTGERVETKSDESAMNPSPR